jgi:hypothetical protein
MFLRVLDALRWSRLARSSLMLGAAFAAGALCAGVLAPPRADVPTPIAMAAVAAPPKIFAPVRSRKMAARKPGRKVAEEAGAKRETVGLAAVEPAVPSATGAPPQAAVALAGEARLQGQTSASTGGEVPRVASDTEQSADELLAQDAEAAPMAAKEARRAKRLAKHSYWRMARTQLDANGPQWAFAWANEGQFTSRHRNARRRAAMADDHAAGPSLFLFGRFDNRHM